MRRYVLHSPFSIYHFEETTWRHVLHRHTYFEIIFIIKGHGLHHINGNCLNYDAGDVFFIGPDDYHEFEIHEITEFSFVRFNESVIKLDKTDANDNSHDIIENLLNTTAQHRGSSVEDDNERKKLHGLLVILEAECENHLSPYFEALRNGILLNMLLIVARNLFYKIPHKPFGKGNVEKILIYIKQNIHIPEKLTIEHLADLFNYAPAYISLFFKRQTGESLKYYVIQHRIKLIEAKLSYGSQTLAEIAFEFGYSDVSHFSKQFKKYTGVTPSSFRRGVIA